MKIRIDKSSLLIELKELKKRKTDTDFRNKIKSITVYEATAEELYSFLNSIYGFHTKADKRERSELSVLVSVYEMKRDGGVLKRKYFKSFSIKDLSIDEIYETFYKSLELESLK